MRQIAGGSQSGLRKFLQQANQTLIQLIYTAYSSLEIRCSAIVLLQLLSRSSSLIQLMYSIFSEGKEKYSSLNVHKYGCRIKTPEKLRYIVYINKYCKYCTVLYTPLVEMRETVLRKYTAYPVHIVATGTHLKTVLWIRIRWIHN
jgi:hypothetical protein